MSFRAKYPGTCASCQEPILVDQLVEYVDDKLEHVMCDAVAPQEREAEVCPNCFTEKSLSGECSC